MTENHENGAGLREIPASEILDKILKGEPVEYDHVIIKGDLDINKCKRDLPKKSEDFIITSRLK